MRTPRLGLLAGGIALLAASQAGAQPYGWFPGSTIGSDNGDRVAVVDLSDGTVLTDHIPNGWQYTNDDPGSDTQIPAFSPDGKYVYLVNGGKEENGNEDGEISVYDTTEVIPLLEAGEVPALSLKKQSFQIISDDDGDSIEPVGLTVSPSGDRAFLVEGKDEKVWSFTIGSDGTLTLLNMIDSGPSPSSFWLSPDERFGFWCSTDDTNDQVTLHVMDILADGGPVEVTPSGGAFVFDLPEASGALELPLGTCGLPLDVQSGGADSVIFSPPPVNATEDAVYVFVGYIGVQVAPISFPPIARTRIGEDSDVYRIDISSGDVDTFTVDNSGSPIHTITPDGDFVIFPPFVQSMDSGTGAHTFIGGSTVIRPDDTLDNLFLPDPQLFPVLGQSSRRNNQIIVGSASEAEVDVFGGGDPTDYVPAVDTSKVYSYPLNSTRRADVTLTELLSVDRSVSFPLGQTENYTVVGGTDTFLVDYTDSFNPDEDNEGSIRNTLCVLVDETTPGLSIVSDTGLIAGAYGQQPFVSVTTPSPEADLFEDSTAIAVGGSVDLGSHVVGSTDPEVTLTMENNGDAELTLGTPSVPTGYSISESLDSTISASGSDTFTISLSTSSAGTFSGTVSIDTNDSDENPYTFTITGTVTEPTAPEVAVLDGSTDIADDGGPVDFGSTTAGSAALSKTFTVENTGTAALTTSDLSVPGSYSVTEGLDASIPAGGSDTFTVELSTASVGTFTGDVEFNNNDSDENPFTFSVTGTVSSAPVPEIAVLDGSTDIADGSGPVDFGSTTAGSAALSKTFTVENTGTAALTTSDLSVPGSYSVTEGLDASIPAGGSDTFTVELSTASVGTFTGDIEFNNNDGDENPFTFSVTGTVSEAPTPEIAVLDDTTEIEDGGGPIDFGSAEVGEDALTKEFTVRNTGTAALTISDVTVPDGYSIAQPLPGSIAASESATLIVELPSDEAGTFSGNIVISSNDADEAMFDFAVTGEITEAPAEVDDGFKVF